MRLPTLLLSLMIPLAACGSDDAVHHLPDGPPVPEAAKGIYLTSAAGNQISVFPLGATGNTAPMRTIVGAATGLSLPIGIEIDDLTGDLYVGNRSGGNVLVFSDMADGNVAPLRTLTAPGLGAAQDVVVLPGGDVLVSCCPTCGQGAGGQPGVFHFAKGASTSDAVLGGPSNANTGLTVPSSLAYDSESSELYVGNSFGGAIETFAITDVGDVAPKRTFQPGGIGNLQSLAYAAGTLFATTPGGVILQFAANSTGNATAASAIMNGGPLNVGYPAGISIDLSESPPVIYLVDYAANALHVIHTAGTAPNLTVASVDTLVGAATGLSQPIAVRVVK